MMIDISGSAGSVREAFHTPLHQIEVNGETHVANMMDPQIPEALAARRDGAFGAARLQTAPHVQDEIGL